MSNQLYCRGCQEFFSDEENWKSIYAHSICLLCKEKGLVECPACRVFKEVGDFDGDVCSDCINEYLEDEEIE